SGGATLSTQAIIEGFDKLLVRMDASQIAKSSDLKGCTLAEIDALERRYRIVLPASYRRYLELMGHGSGRLFASDHVAVSYSYVLELTEDVTQRRIDAREETNEPLSPSGFHLSPDSLIISGRWMGRGRSSSVSAATTRPSGTSTKSTGSKDKRTRPCSR